MSNKLAEILSRSKAVMDKAEREYGSTSKITNYDVNESSYEEKEMPNLTENFINSRVGTTNSVAPQNGRYRNMEKSKMPDFIKKAMIDEPIDIPETPYHTFELEDVPELVKESVTKIVNKTESKSVNETKNLSTNNKTSLNENLIRKIVKEEMENVVRSVIEEYLDKSLMTEDIQIKVGGTTFSGTLKPLPKRRQ